MTLRAWWDWFRTLKENPIYQREAGLIGDPNPFYTNLRRYTVLFFLAAVVLGSCGGFSNRTMLSGVDPAMAVAQGLVCVPGVLISMLTIYGLLMAPALTAPMLTLEQDKGSWDILRLTPHALNTIVVAKLFGGLRRLGIWVVLAVLTVFQALVFLGSIFFTEGEFVAVGLTSALTAVALPFLEILLSALLGLYLSMWIRSAPTTLAVTYGGLLLYRVLSSVTFFLIFLEGSNSANLPIIAALTIAAPVIIALLAIILLGFGITKRVKNYG